VVELVCEIVTEVLHHGQCHSPLHKCYRFSACWRHCYRQPIPSITGMFCSYPLWV